MSKEIIIYKMKSMALIIILVVLFSLVSSRLKRSDCSNKELVDKCRDINDAISCRKSFMRGRFRSFTCKWNSHDHKCHKYSTC